MVEMQPELLPAGKMIVIKDKKKHTTCLHYYAAYTHKEAGRREIVDITLGAYKLPGKTNVYRYLTLTLYPSQFQGGEFEHFKWIFDNLMGDITYSGLYHMGKVTYLELAADSLSQKQHSFLPYRKYVSKSNIWQEANGPFGTTYVGSKDSDFRFRVYDKRKQLLDKGKPSQFEILPHTRVEVVKRKLGVTPIELIHMKNPFVKLLIADLAKAKAASPETDWQNFVSECLIVGVPEALSNHPQQRKQYRAALDNVQAPWWQPEAIWQDLPKALAVIAP
jgi:hypothetical protein